MENNLNWKQKYQDLMRMFDEYRRFEQMYREAYYERGRMSTDLMIEHDKVINSGNEIKLLEVKLEDLKDENRELQKLIDTCKCVRKSN